MKTKAIVASLCAVLLVTVSVLGTMAYLTSHDAVTNTFTVGNVAITLDEAKVNPDGTVVTNADRVKANMYHLIPGHEYTKDPVIHVDSDSEDCWLFIKLENGLEDIIVDNTSIEAQIAANGWEIIDSTENIYAYKSIVSGGTDIAVFEEFQLNGDAELAEYENANITVTGYAVQADGFSTAIDAWTAANL